MCSRWCRRQRERTKQPTRLHEGQDKVLPPSWGFCRNVNQVLSAPVLVLQQQIIPMQLGALIDTHTRTWCTTTQIQDMFIHMGKCLHDKQLISMTGLFLEWNNKACHAFDSSPQSLEYFVEAKVLHKGGRNEALAGMLYEEHLRDRWCECKNEAGGGRIK